MEALITASGKGIRLRPITYNTPKALVEVCGKPAIDYIIDYLNEVGIEDEKITVTVGYKREKIFEHLSNRHIKKYVISYEPESMAHVVTVASHLMREPFVVVGADSIQPAAVIKDSYKVFNDLNLSMLFHCLTKNRDLVNKVISFEEYLFEHDRLEKETNGKEYIKYTAVFYDPKALQEIEAYVPHRDEKFKHTKIGELIHRNGGQVRCLFTDYWYAYIDTPEELIDAEKLIRQLMI